MRYEQALKQVMEAAWIEGMQGSTGWYTLLLSCGHRESCSARNLRPLILCQECLEKLLKEEKAAP